MKNGSILGSILPTLAVPFFVATLCLLFLVSALGGQQHPSSATTQPSSVLAQARSALAEGNVTGAIQTLSNHLQTHPNDTSARLLLADAYLAQKQDPQAEEQYQIILQSAPDNYLALAGVGEIYERAGDAEKAEPILARAAQISGGNPKIRSAWAAVLSRLHRYQDAAKALAGVAPPASSQERISFYRLKASVAAGLGDTAGAAAEMEKAFALGLDRPDLEMATAAAELQAKHWKRAAGLSKALFDRTHQPQAGAMLLAAQLGSHEDIRPTLDAFNRLSLPLEQEVMLRQRLAELLIAHQRFSDSIDELKRAVELAPERADLRFNLALILFRAGRLDDALKSAQSLAKESDSAELQDLIADIQEARGDSLAAARSYEAAIKLAPNEEKYRLSLALELMRHSSFEPARVVLEQAAQLRPESWRVQLALGMLEYFAGSPENASTTLLKAARLAPDPEPALNYLGEIQIDQSGIPDAAALSTICQYGDGRPRAAKIQFYCAALLFRRDYASQDHSRSDEILSRLNASAIALPDDASPHCQLGRVYRWIERWPEALRETETCARMDPNSPDAHYRLAQIYQHLGQQHRSEQEMTLYQAASARIASENARRDETIKTFLYSIQNDTTAPK